MIKTISDFAEERNIDRGTVNAWIRNHPEVDKVCIRKGKDKLIDTTLPEYQLLENQYPLPQMVEIVEDKESRLKLIRAQELIIQLQEKLNEVSQQVAIAQSAQILLEDKSEQLEKTEKTLEKAEKNLEAREKELSDSRLACDEMKDKLFEAEKRILELESRGFWARVFNK